MEANPILARELKERMRSLRAPLMLTVYLVILGLIVFGTERAVIRSTNLGAPFASAAAGRAVFHWLLFFMLMLVCFLVPGFTAGTISSERERQTFQLLQVTLMSPRAIVLGKLASSMSFLVLLLAATLPLLSVAFILGGVSPGDVLRGYGMVLLTGFTIAMLGVAFSAVFRRTLSATLVSYAMVATLCVGTVVAYGLGAAMFRPTVFEGNRNPVYTLVLNPFLGTASALMTDAAVRADASPFDAMATFLRPDGWFGFDDLGGAPRPRDDGGVPVWVSTAGWYLGLSLAGYLLAVSMVRTPTHGLRSHSRRGRGAES